MGNNPLHGFILPPWHGPDVKKNLNLMGAIISDCTDGSVERDHKDVVQKKAVKNVMIYQISQNETEKPFKSDILDYLN